MIVVMVMVRLFSSSGLTLERFSVGILNAGSLWGIELTTLTLRLVGPYASVRIILTFTSSSVYGTAGWCVLLRKSSVRLLIVRVMARGSARLSLLRAA